MFRHNPTSGNNLQRSRMRGCQTTCDDLGCSINQPPPIAETTITNSAVLVKGHQGMWDAERVFDAQNGKKQPCAILFFQD